MFYCTFSLKLCKHFLCIDVENNCGVSEKRLRSSNGICHWVASSRWAAPLHKHAIFWIPLKPSKDWQKLGLKKSFIRPFCSTIAYLSSKENGTIWHTGVNVFRNDASKQVQGPISFWLQHKCVCWFLQSSCIETAQAISVRSYIFTLKALLSFLS